MSKPVVFVTGLGKPVTRAENLYTLYQAYPGEKKILSMHDMGWEAEAKKASVMVCDIFPTCHPCLTIMMWHAIQGGKYIGLDEKTTYYHKEYADFMDAIVVAGHGGIEMFHRCTGVPKERIFNMGMPRTDRYIGKKKGDGGTPYADKRVYLYVPTFRNWRETPMPCIDWEFFSRNLTDDEVLIVKPHPYGNPISVNGMKHLVEANKMTPTVNYLYDADVIITDYSSVMFDGWLLNKPAVLFEKNPGYTKTRGMYLEYPKQYSSRYARNEQELLDLMRSAKRLTKVEKECRDYVADACDGHSCERIIVLINQIERMI